VKEMVDTLYNHPSIGMWVVFNESWGQFNTKQIYKWLSAYDSSRYIDTASGWFDQGAGYIKSIHIYFRKLKWPKTCRERAIIISEYGGYSLQIKGHLWRDKNNFGYKAVKTPDELEMAYSNLYNQQVKPLIKRGLSGVVYTQLSDVENEVNGLLTYDREYTKINPDRLYKLHKEYEREQS